MINESTKQGKAPICIRKKKMMTKAAGTPVKVSTVSFPIRNSFSLMQIIKRPASTWRSTCSEKMVTPQYQQPLKVTAATKC
jgi:hypothetical protein